MPLQLDVGVAAAEDADDAIEQAADAEALGAQQRPARQGDEAGGEAVEIVRARARPRLSARAASSSTSSRQRLRQPSCEAHRTGRGKRDWEPVTGSRNRLVRLPLPLPVGRFRSSVPRRSAA